MTLTVEHVSMTTAATSRSGWFLVQFVKRPREEPTSWHMQILGHLGIFLDGVQRI